MRWYPAGAGRLALMMMTGCSTAFGKDSRVTKAVRKDSLEFVRKICDKNTRDRFCSGGRENTPECIEKYG